jgi:hypothetical protein
MKVNRPVYELHLRPEPGVDAVRALRGVLKVALRQFGMKCTSCEEIPGSGNKPPDDQQMERATRTTAQVLAQGYTDDDRTT